MTPVKYVLMKDSNNLLEHLVVIRYVESALKKYVKMIIIDSVQYVDKNIGFTFSKIKINNKNDYYSVYYIKF